MPPLMLHNRPRGNTHTRLCFRKRFVENDKDWHCAGPHSRSRVLHVASSSSPAPQAPACGKRRQRGDNDNRRTGAFLAQHEGKSPSARLIRAGSVAEVVRHTKRAQAHRRGNCPLEGSCCRPESGRPHHRPPLRPMPRRQLPWARRRPARPAALAPDTDPRDPRAASGPRPLPGRRGRRAGEWGPWAGSGLGYAPARPCEVGYCEWCCSGDGPALSRGCAVG